MQWPNMPVFKAPQVVAYLAIRFGVALSKAPACSLKARQEALLVVFGTDGLPRPPVYMYVKWRLGILISVSRRIANVNSAHTQIGFESGLDVCSIDYRTSVSHHMELQCQVDKAELGITLPHQ